MKDEENLDETFEWLSKRIDSITQKSFVRKQDLLELICDLSNRIDHYDPITENIPF